MSGTGKGVDVNSLAKLFDLTPRRIQQLANDGVIPKAAHGLYPLLPAIKGYIGFLQQAQRGSTPASVASELAQLRLARARLALQREELDFAEDAGQLVMPDDCVAAVAGVVEAARTTLQLVPRRYGHNAEDRARLKAIASEVLASVIDRAQLAMQVLTGEAEALPDTELDEAVGVATEALEEDTPEDEGEALGDEA